MIRGPYFHHVNRFKKACRKVICHTSIIIFLALYALPAKGQTEDSELIAIQKSGQSRIASGDLSRARLDAVREAYKDAVGEGAGEDIGELLLFQNLKRLTEIIVTRSPGFVNNYLVVDEGPTRENMDIYQVAIKADVASRTLSRKPAEPGLKKYVELLENPKILVMLPEVDLDEDTQTTYERSFESGGTSFRSTEAAAARAFAELGYQVGTSDDLLANETITSEMLEQAKSGVSAQAVKVAKAVDADILLTGVIRTKTEKMDVNNVPLFMTNAELSAKAVIISSGKTAGAYHFTERASFPEKTKSRSDCLDNLADKIAADLIWKIPAILAYELRETALKISNISKIQTLDIKDALKKLPGIEKVTITTFPDKTNNRAEFIIATAYLRLPNEDLLQQCKLALNYPLETVNADKYEINCKLPEGESQKAIDL